MLWEYGESIKYEADNEMVWFSNVVSQVIFPCYVLFFSFEFHVALAQRLMNAAVLDCKTLLY